MSTTQLLSQRYALGGTLGTGGMSEVRHGYDVRLGRDVAIKVLRADLADDPTFLERFQLEARHAASLNHPAIVAVYDTGETRAADGSPPYIVMEYVDGRTLREILRASGALPQSVAIEVMADVCAALDFSHRHGIVHRDVKPANVMLTRRGAVKVMDFGIASALHDTHAGVAQGATVLGTALYLAPEQAMGEQADARTDVYAAGCVLYELLTGVPPFTGDSPVAVARRHVTEAPLPPSSVNPDISKDLEAVVLTALAKAPSARYSSAATMRADLLRVSARRKPAAAQQATTDDTAARLRAQHARRRQLIDDDDDERRVVASRRTRPYTTLLIAAGGAVLLVLAGLFLRGESVAAVPALTGEGYLVAESTLKDAGFTAITRVSVNCWAREYGMAPPCTRDDYGRVLRTEPSAGTQVSTSTRIILHVGRAPETLTMPGLTQHTLADAEKLIKDKNLLLNPGIEWVSTSDPEQAGRVAGQNPRQGATVAEGDEVRLSVYGEPEMIEVTDYTGRPYDVAEAGLSAAGFLVTRTNVDSDRPRGEVLRQSPRSGEAVRGSEIALEVSTGAFERLTMPSLEGKPERAARDMLRRAGHTGEVRIERAAVTDRSEHGRIIATHPRGGDTVRKDATVTLRVGRYTAAQPPPTTPPSPAPVSPSDPPTETATPTPSPSEDPDPAEPSPQEPPAQD